MRGNEDMVGRSILRALYTLWRGWAYGVGLLILANSLAIILSKKWLPVIMLLMALIMYTTLRLNTLSKRATCMRMAYLCTLTMVWSAIVMFIINLLYIHAPDLPASLGVMPLNPRIPYIAILVISTVSVVLSGWMIYKGDDHHFCRDCRALFGNTVERGFIGKLFQQEGDFQLHTFFLIMLMIALGDYIYYALYYINVSINSPDRFFFIYAPAIIYVASLIFLGIRYMCVWVYYDRSVVGGPVYNGSMTNVRFLIISGDDIFLTKPDNDTQVGHAGDEQIDTPAKLALSYRERITDYDADQYFKGVASVTPSKVRYLYTNDGTDTGINTFHFACFITNPADMERSRCRGVWMSLNDLQRQAAEGHVAPMLISEIERIYAATTAWKSYDRRGYRLYDIKRYKPAFRLRDFPNWDLDYNDPTWLLVAENNEDRPFFRVRRLWRKYITGLSE